MNSTQKRDIYYSFVKTARKPVLTSIIDEEWRRQTLKGIFYIFHSLELDIKLPANLNNKFNVEANNESENRRGNLNPETKDWPDLGINELVSIFLDFYSLKIAQLAEPKLDFK